MPFCSRCFLGWDFPTSTWRASPWYCTNRPLEILLPIFLIRSTKQVFTLHSWGSWGLKRNPPKNSQGVGRNTDGAYKMVNIWIYLNLESIANFPVSDGFMMVTLPETNIAPENGWLEYEVSVWDGLLAGAMLVLGSVMNQFLLNKSPHGFGYCFSTSSIWLCIDQSPVTLWPAS